MREKLIIMGFIYFAAALVCGCHADAAQQRLKATISELKRTEGGKAYSIARRKEQIAGLEALVGNDLSRPHVLHAAFLPKGTQGVFPFVVDYAAVQPDTKFFRIYYGNGHVQDLIESESSQKLNRMVEQETVLYSAVWYFDSGDPPAFGDDTEAYVEIHNRNGAISPRFRIQNLCSVESL